MKQEVRAQLTAMSREHVTDEDIQIFARVQEVALQVRSRRPEVDVTHEFNLTAAFREPVDSDSLSGERHREMGG